MEQTATQSQINLFADTLPGLDEIKQLTLSVNSSETSRIAFAEKLEPNMSSGSQKILLAAGIALYILGRNAEAAVKLQKAKDCKEKFIYLAYAQRSLNRFDEAIENLQKSLDYEADKLNICMEKAATHRHAGNFEAAEKELKACANYEKVSAEYHYQLGRLAEAQGLYDKAAENFQKAIELSPNHQKALFHLAYRCDLSGDEEAAMSYYKQITANSPVYTSALLNLTILHEDEGNYDKASECVEKVLKHHPNHPRALLFKKDIDSSKTMFYDEEKAKKKDIKTQMLSTPITDFELSVRSRNCLKKMKIDTLGDLLNTTEAELLAYKNFGETSLREIKAILDVKGLHLGMALEETQAPSLEIPVETPAEDEGLLSKSVDELQLSVRAKNCLSKLNIRTIGDLIQKTEAELLGVKNFGMTSLNEIKKVLSGLGLGLRNLD